MLARLRGISEIAALRERMSSISMLAETKCGRERRHVEPYLRACRFAANFTASRAKVASVFV